MKPVELKVARIGNSRGVRLPAATLARYDIGARVIMEERTDGILLRPPGDVDAKLSWDDTAREMEAANEDWQAWDAVAGDGLAGVPWDVPGPSRVAESTPESKTRGRVKPRSRKA